MTETAPSNATNAIQLRGAKKSKKSQRDAMYTYLSHDEEYANIEDHVIVDEMIEDKLDEEVQNETRLVSVTNVMKLVYLDIQGYGTGAISENMAMSVADVQTIRRSEAFKNAKEAMMTALVAKSRQMMEVSTMKAVKTLTECMESKNDKVRLSAAVEVLNRTGLNAIQKIELTTTNNTMLNLSEDELKEILRSNQAIPAEAEVIPDGK